MSKKYIYGDENGNIHIISEEDLPKCPRTGGISPRVWIIGEKSEFPKVQHINGKCNEHIFCKSLDKDFKTEEKR